MTDERATVVRDAKKKLLEAYEMLTECCQGEWKEYYRIPISENESPKSWRIRENAMILEEILPDLDAIILDINGVEDVI